MKSITRSIMLLAFERNLDKDQNPRLFKLRIQRALTTVSIS